MKIRGLENITIHPLLPYFANVFYNLPFPLLSRGWFMILVFITSAGVPIVAAVNAATILDSA